MSDWFHAWELYYFPGRAFYPADREEDLLPPEFRLKNRDLRIPREGSGPAEPPIVQ